GFCTCLCKPFEKFPRSGLLPVSIHATLVLMVHRTLLLAFSFVAIFALIACGNDDDDAEATPDNNTAEETVDASSGTTASPSDDTTPGSEPGDDAEATPDATS